MIIHPAVTASASRRAYDDDPNPAALGLDLFATFDSGGTQAFLARSDRLLLLAFRGTEAWEDFFADLRYVKTDFPGGGRVHAGFLGAFEPVRNQIDAVLAAEDPTLKRVFTGHSLGAALALCAGATFPADEVHTFGCPRTGNKDFVKRIACPIYRFVNWGDLVTRVPPPNSLAQAVHAIRHGRLPTLYRHAGKKIRLDGRGHRSRQYEHAAAEYPSL